MTGDLGRNKNFAAKIVLLSFLAFSFILVLYMSQNITIAASPQAFLRPSPPPGNSGTPQYSEIFYASDNFRTYYSEMPGSISLGTSFKNYMPFTSQILSYNKDNASWLITCPDAPNPSNTQEYFQPIPNSFIAGDTCLITNPYIQTQIALIDAFSWSPSSLASTTASVSIDNIGQANVNNYAYSGDTQNLEGALNVSNGYDTNSYIFDYVPPSTQQGVWGWTTQFADLSNADLAKLQQQQTFNLYINQPELYSNTVNGVTTTWYWVCTYPYTYSFNSKIESIQNSNAPIPLYYASQPFTFLSYNGMEVPVSTIKTTAPPYRFTLSCGFSQLQNMYNGCNVPGWKKETYGGGAVLYINGTDWNSQSCDGYSGYTGEIYKNDTNPNEYGTVYGSVCPFGSIGWHDFSLDTFNTTFMGANVIPYLLYNFTMPSVISNANGKPEYLNMSYDLYSPHNYLNPANSLDTFTLDTGSGFLANYNGSLTLFPYNSVSLSDSNPSSLDHGISYFLSSLTSSSVPSFNFGIGKYIAGKVHNSTFIALSPNDYLYVANYSAQGSFFSGSSKAFIYTMRFIPLGYFNVTNYAPAVEVMQSFSQKPTAQDYSLLYSQWWTDWEKYWGNVTMQQSSDLYVTNITSLSSYSYSCTFWSCGHGILGNTLLRGFRPTGIATDYSGDIFVVGLNNAGTKDMLAVVYTNGTVVQDTITPSPKFVSSDEIAVTPNGKYIYIANESSGEIAIYQAPSLAQVGTIDLSYSNFTSSLNISSYFAYGGPFNSTALAAYRGLSTSNDISAYHHPIGLAEYEGVLYVLDNWTDAAAVGSGQTNLPAFSILMLRAYNGNGTEIPIDSFKHNDLISSNSLVGTITAVSSSYPPYGWPLSANITLPNSNNQISYCGISSAYGAKACDTPSESESNGYPPIGPFISASGEIGPNPNDTGFSSNFNGDFYLITHTYSMYPGYTQLLSFGMNVENYTKTSLGAYSHYVCYVNSTKINSPYCTSLSGSAANTLTLIYPPVIGIPDSFDFSESNGPLYFGYQNLVSTSFPVGFGGADPPYEPSVSISANPIYQGTTDNVVVTSNTEVPNDQLSLKIANSTKTITKYGSGKITYNINSLGIGNYRVQGCDTTQNSCAPNQTLSILSQPLTSPTSPGTIIPPVAPTSSYLDSIISGYILVPYNITYSLVQNYSPNPDNSGYVSAGLPPPMGYNGFAGPDCPPYSFTNSTNYYVQYATLPISVQSSELSSTLQDGGTYIEYANQKYYDANISDANLILPPSSLMTLFTNRMFGDVYINQTVLPGGTLPRPYVLNNSLNGYYFTNNFTQRVLFRDYPGYESQTYVPIMHRYGSVPVQMPFYYNPTFSINYQNYFNYTNFTSLSFVPLFEIYRVATYQNNVEINVTGSPRLGYNRLIFTYVDQFNNTIYMPFDVDFANLTTINLNVSTAVNALNPNETKINVNGTAYSLASTISPVPVPLPSGSPIYIYYDTNLNFYNSSVPYDTPVSSIVPYLDYCAFSPNAQGCSLADYLSPKEYSALESNTIDFKTQLNATGQCSPEPKSLLAVGNFVQCNIYPNNQWGLPQYGVGAVAQPEYCVPVYQNGTGYLTSQLGLVHIAKTNSEGAFSYNFSVCGTGSDSVAVKYYGWPPPEPIEVSQVPLSSSATDFSGCNGGKCNTYEEYNFSMAPDSASQSFNIGLYELGLGNIDFITLIIFISAVAAIFAIFSTRARSRPKVHDSRS